MGEYRTVRKADLPSDQPTLFVQEPAKNHPAKRRPYPRFVRGWVYPCVPGPCKGSPGSLFSHRRAGMGTGVRQEKAISLRRRMNLAKTMIPSRSRPAIQSTPPDPPSLPHVFRPFTTLSFPIVKPFKIIQKSGQKLLVE